MRRNSETVDKCAKDDNDDRLELKTARQSRILILANDAIFVFGPRNCYELAEPRSRNEQTVGGSHVNKVLAASKEQVVAYDEH